MLSSDNSGIYKITLRQDGRCYIGSAININARWRQHIQHSESDRENIQVICRAIRKYGADAFDWEVLEHCEPENLILREQHYLDTLQPFVNQNKGFNIREVADSNLGITLSPETRQKMSDSRSGVKKSEPHKQSIRDSWHDNRDDTYYKNLSERLKGDKNPAKRDEVRKKISESMKGKTWKDDTERVAKHIESRLGSKRTAEQRKRMSEAQRGSKRTDETKEKFYMMQRNLYKVHKPCGDTFEMYSRELKEYCKEIGIHYSNLISTAKTGKSYKGG